MAIAPRSASRVAHEGDAAVVGNVEPLVRVGGPRVGALDAGDERSARGRGGRPESERAIDVHPRAGGSRARDNVGERIERAGVHVAGLQTDDRPIVERGQRVGAHAALPIGGDARDAGAAEAEHAERLERGDVDFVTDDDGDRRRAEEPLRLDVPAGALRARVCRAAASAGEVRPSSRR